LNRHQQRQFVAPTLPSYPEGRHLCHREIVSTPLAIGYHGQTRTFATPGAMHAMRVLSAVLLVSFTFGVAFGGEDETSAIVARQKQAAEANCKTVQLGQLAQTESDHFLVYGASAAPRLKLLATNLEKTYATAVKGLQFEADATPWTGKLAVYVFADRGQLRSFIRQIEKRSPDDGEQSSVSAGGDTPHIAVAPGQGKEAATPDTQAGYDVALALLAARAKGAPVPEWLTQGFARATAAQAANTPASVRKRVARQLAGRTKPMEAWNDMLSIEQRLPLATSLADYLFYGKGLSRPGDFLVAFRPDDEKPMKTIADAFEAVKLTPEKFEAAYLVWLRGNN
jgi:hypothetical protein